MRIEIKTLLATSVLSLWAVSVQAQTPQRNDSLVVYPRWGLKTNLLYDATATVNVGAEFQTGEHTSAEVSVNVNAWTFAGNRKWKQLIAQPEFRWWPRGTYNGHFVGLHGFGGIYNIGALPNPPLSPYMAAHRFQGWLAGAGLNYGYRLNLNGRLALEATVGAGYAYLSHEIYPCEVCGELIGTEARHYFGPTRAALNIIYGFGSETRSESRPVSVREPRAEREPRPEREPRSNRRTQATPVPTSAPTPEAVGEPMFAAIFIVPAAEPVKSRSESGQAFLDFAQGRSEIVSSFRNNAAELQRINDMVHRILDDPDATITGITITGYASVEGTYDSNLALSERRALALRDLVGNVNRLPASLFAVTGAGEDWDGLAELVNRSNISRKSQILDIIRNTDIFAGREKQLMELAGGEPYRQMRVEFFPRLRRSDYRIDYTMAAFTAEQAREVLRSRPENLSLNEMFNLANTYEPGSDAFNEVFEVAARVFPDSDVANTNAAAIALGRRDVAAAAAYLNRVAEQGVAYWNNLGLLWWMQGDADKAAQCFSLAGEQAADNAAALNRYLSSTRR